MTGDMSTHIKPRKKALRVNRKPSQTGWAVLLALMVALGAADRCDARAAVNTDAPPPAATAPRSRSQRPLHPTPAQVIDANVHLLAQGLKLDREQQRKLREILVDQHAQLMKLRT